MEDLGVTLGQRIEANEARKKRGAKIQTTLVRTS
jgi:hypothetical protein